MLKEPHPFLGLYPLRAGLRYLIVGTIPPNRDCPGRTGILDYFYGNDWTLWSLIQPLYPTYDLRSLDSVLQWEKDFCVGFSDTVKQCRRLEACSPCDKDLNLSIEDYNYPLKDYIINNTNSLQKIFLTSCSGPFNTLNNLKKIMGNSFKAISGKLVKLPSPSGSSNLSLFKGTELKFGLVDSFYDFLRDNHPEVLDYAKQTWEKKMVSTSDKKVSRLPKDRKYTDEYKKWFYSNAFSQLVVENRPR